MLSQTILLAQHSLTTSVWIDARQKFLPTGSTAIADLGLQGLGMGCELGDARLAHAVHFISRDLSHHFHNEPHGL